MGVASLGWLPLCQYNPVMSAKKSPSPIKKKATAKKAVPRKVARAAKKTSKKTAKKPTKKPSKKQAKAPAVKKPKGRRRPVGPEAVHEIFARFRTANPEPKGELEHVNVFTLLVAVVLSAQATDAGVNKATRALFAIADTPEKMVALGEEKIRDYVKTIGLFRTKAKNVYLLSRELIEKYGSDVPRSREILETLPGVGRKTANVVMNMAFGEPTIAVDTHLFRVSNRIPLAIGKTPLAIELGLEKVIPAEFMRHAHHWLILHGRYICKARRPDCERCLISDICTSPEKTI